MSERRYGRTRHEERVEQDSHYDQMVEARPRAIAKKHFKHKPYALDFGQISEEQE